MSTISELKFTCVPCLISSLVESCACLEHSYVMHLLLPFFIFMHLHLASHLGTLDEPCEACDDGVEPEDGVGGPIPKMEGPLECA